MQFHRVWGASIASPQKLHKHWQLSPCVEAKESGDGEEAFAVLWGGGGGGGGGGGDSWSVAVTGGLCFVFATEDLGPRILAALQEVVIGKTGVNFSRGRGGVGGGGGGQREIKRGSQNVSKARHV